MRASGVTKHPAPWGELLHHWKEYIEECYFPPNVEFGDPDKISTIMLDKIIRHWYERQKINADDIFRFRNVKSAKGVFKEAEYTWVDLDSTNDEAGDEDAEGNVTAPGPAPQRKRARRKGKGKQRVVQSDSDSDEDGQSKDAQDTPAPSTNRLASEERNEDQQVMSALELAEDKRARAQNEPPKFGEYLDSNRRCFLEALARGPAMGTLIDHLTKHKVSECHLTIHMSISHTCREIEASPTTM